MNTYQNIMAFYEGWDTASSDEVEKGIALMQRSLAVLEGKNVASHRPHFLSLLAQIQVRAGDVRSALARAPRHSKERSRLDNVILTRRFTEAKVKRDLQQGIP